MDESFVLLRQDLGKCCLKLSHQIKQINKYTTLSAMMKMYLASS